MKKLKRSSNLYKYIFIILISFLVFIFEPLKADDTISIDNNIKNIDSKLAQIIEIKVLISQFNRGGIFNKLDFLENAGKYFYQKNIKDIYYKCYNSHNPEYKITILNTINKNNIPASDLILEGLTNNNKSIKTAAVKCLRLTSDTVFFKSTNYIYNSYSDTLFIMLLPEILKRNNKLIGKNWLRKCLYHKSFNVRNACYSLIFQAAPKYFEYAILGLYDNEKEIRMMLLDNLKKYTLKQQKKILSYAATNKSYIVRTYARKLLKKY